MKAEMDMDKPEVLDKSTIKALSTQTRQEILKMLSRRPYTASELSKLLSKHVTTVTEHLDVLEKSGVIRRKESTNKWIYYVLSDKGEKLFKPYYSWVVLLSVSILVFAVGVMQFTFVSYSAQTFKISESLAAETGAAPAADQRIFAESSYLNIYIGIALLVAALIILWIAMKKRHARFKEKVEIYRHLMNA